MKTKGSGGVYGSVQEIRYGKEFKPYVVDMKKLKELQKKKIIEVKRKAKKEHLQQMRDKARKEANRKNKVYIKNWVKKTENSSRKTVACKISVKANKELGKKCNKLKITPSTYIRNLILKDLGFSDE